jgi:hypothetical protein
MSRKAWMNDTPYRMLDRNLKRMGLTMLVGAIVDVILALAGLLFPGWVISLMGLDVPQEMFFFQMWPLVHLIFPCFYILAYMDTKRNVVIVTGAIVARVIYALYMVLSVVVRGVRWTWIVPAGICLALAISHYVFLRLSDFGFWEVFSRAGNPPGMKGK